MLSYNQAFYDLKKSLQQLYDAQALAIVDEHVLQLFGNASADQYGNWLCLERAGRGRSSDGGWRGVVFVSASGLGLANGGGAPALRRAALDPRYHWGIPWPTSSHRQPKASICRERSAAYRAL